MRNADGTPRWVLALLLVLGAPAGGVAQSPDPPSSLPDTIPLFPLPDVTLLPNTTQPFHIFEPRYRAMIADALAGDSIVGMAVLQPGFEDDYEGRPAVFALGCAGVIVSAERLADGRYNVLLRGLEKFEILEEDESRPYRLARVEGRMEGTPTDFTLLERQRRRLQDAVRSAYPRAPLPSPDLPDADAIDGLAIAVPLELSQRLELLEADGPGERASILVRLLTTGVQASL